MTAVIMDYALGGATAVLFYAEPTRTYDLDVFVTLPPGHEGLAALEEIDRWTGALGFGVDAEHVMIHGVPVQFLPAFNQLVVSAIRDARPHDYDGAAVRVVDPEPSWPLLSRREGRVAASGRGSCSRRVSWIASAYE